MHKLLAWLVFIPLVSGVVQAEAPVNAPAALDVRLDRERDMRDKGTLVLPYKPNYFLPFSHNFNMNQLSSDTQGDERLQQTEAKFQLSVRMPLIRGVFWNHGTLQLAYTQLSYWQMYNDKISGAFRETNYEPEATFVFDTNYSLLGWKGRLLNAGIIHQSNGRAGALSRGWNRAAVELDLERGNALVSIKPWYRMPDHGGDDNPDIRRYMGDFELGWAWKYHDQVTALLIRNNLYFQGNNKGAVQVSYSFPLFRLLRGYLQYFNGYGESLLDYNHFSNRISAGLAFSDWL